MRNIALRLSYDGSRYHGWQLQRSELTVAGALETALSAVCGPGRRVTGCGRTDAGVHALVYCANFSTDSKIPAHRLPYALNSRLPPDIAVSAALDVPVDFDAVVSCIKKEYTYEIYCSRLPDPFRVNRAYRYPLKPDVGAMRSAAAAFVGTLDFAAMRSAGSRTKTTVRTVFRYDIDCDGDTIRLRVCADGFLYNMARAMAGTLLYVSEGKISPDGVPALLASGDRRLAGPTVPARGLYMTGLWYDGPAGDMFTDRPSLR
ncbi:MAG: tRNA pseudouridine(38-40) synthase TruA [Oscillospiraceae bacterium]|jgi:tRNA pseudouridine38-40 synthase|nr:tRNA pseudouridine(38-40) synthase TruA [Oscillospiraceae bacterium]